MAFEDGMDPSLLSNQNLIDQLCDEFEESWKRGETPDLNDYLQSTTPELRSTLLLELVRVDLEYLSNRGQPLSLPEYARRHPQWEQEIAKLQLDRPSARDALADLKTIGSLQLTERLGTGTFGDVWKAWDSRLEREVAVKLPTERSLGRKYIAEFRREAKAAAKLNHPGIVRVIGFDLQDGIAYIVYDLVKGITLQKWLKQHPVSVLEAATLCKEIALALAHAHGQGVYHRDLKPGNILLDAERRPLITDFGLAKRVDTTSTATESGVIAGTLAYMSPEQADARPGTIDGRSDIYSLGVILFEMLAGRPIFEGTARELIQQILFVPPPRLSSHAATVPADLETICHKCLEKNKSDRFQNAAELADELRRFLNNETIKTRPVGRIGRFCRRLRGRRSLLVVVGVLCASFLGLFMWNKTQPTPPGRWNVLVQTNPDGAHAHVVPFDAETGVFLIDQQSGSLDLTPMTLPLRPGNYQVHVVLPGNPQRTHQVIRTVPPIGTTMALGGRNPLGFRITGTRSLEWPPIKIPEPTITKEMVYIEGVDEFPIGDPAKGKRVRLAPFYVSPREFTFGDLLKLRPNSTTKPADHTMPVSWDAAQHWAEEAGGRLLTEVEFEYLAVLAAAEERQNANMDLGPEQFHVAGADLRDAIPSDPPVRGILSGFAEWTSSYPNQTDLWDPLALSKATDYRVIRGGSASTGPGELNRDPRARSAVRYFEMLPTVGFRVARNAEAPPPKRD